MKSLVKYNTIYSNSINPYKYFMFIMLMFVFVFILLKSIKINKYYVNSGIVKSNKELEIIVNRNDLNKVYNNKKIIINNKNFAYNIKSISEPIFYNDYYYTVVLDIELDNNINIVNNFLDFKILLDKETIIKYIYNKIGG